MPTPMIMPGVVKVRPAVVASDPLYHATEPDLLLAAITSKVSAATGPLGGR